VVRLAAAGKTNQGIAADLYVSVKTVEGHLAKAYRKLGVDSRQSLALALDSCDDPEELIDSPAS
jgi:DNA-binding NarL/FixJ family response regulator